MKISTLNRIFLFGASLLSAYQVVVGIEGHSSVAILCYTIGFGVVLVACLLMVILGLDVLESPLVVILSTVIPLSLSMGLIAEFSSVWLPVYLTFSGLGLLAIILTRVVRLGKIAIVVLAIVHGIAGLVIFGLPIFLALKGTVPVGFILVGAGGALIGLGGLLLFFMRAGSPLVTKSSIYKIFPALILVTISAFVAGFLLVR